MPCSAILDKVSKLTFELLNSSVKLFSIVTLSSLHSSSRLIAEPVTGSYNPYEGVISKSSFPGLVLMLTIIKLVLII